MISNRPTCRQTWIIALVLAAALQGCAAVRKCGIRGCPGDAQITSEVQALLEQHPELEAPNLLSVHTLDRVVYLSGLVDTDYEREIAQSVALQAAGVNKVVNSIGLSGNK